MGKTIAIDLGTTNSAVAIFQGGKSEILNNKEGKATTPSIVAFTDKGDVLVGDPARRQAITNPEKTIESIKRIMGMEFNDEKIKSAKEKVSYKIVDKNGMAAIEVDGKIYTPQEISAKILSKLKTDAEEVLGEKVTDAVITVPAYFNDSQRKATQEAGTIAGLNVLRIINEPTAAAMSYGLDKNEENILVFDFGGGTHDVSVLEIGDGTFEVLSTDGNPFLGGNDIDIKLSQFIVDEFNNQEGIDVSKDNMAMQRIMDASEVAKKELSSTEETNINLPFLTANETGPKHLNISLTRAKFEGMIEDIVKDTLIHVETAIKDSGLAKSDIDEIIMVGGSTRIPLVQKRVSEYFDGKELNKSVNPDEVVALGAAIQAGVLSGDVKDVLLLDVTPLSMGIETMGGIMTKMIEKGTTIPVSKKEVYSTAADNQPEVTINIATGNNELFEKNKHLGQFTLEGIPAAPRGVPQIEVTFNIDANGTLDVSAIDKGTGKEKNITITGSGNLSEDEINKMILEAEEDNKKNADKIEAIKKRNELDGFSSQIRKQAKDSGIEINSVPGLEDILSKSDELVKSSSEDKNEIEKTINDLKNIAQNMGQQQQAPQESTVEDGDIIDAEID